jgi:DNA-binding GntR family transcriptional regulator
MATQTEIAQRVVESILAQKLKPGERLGEQELADMFGVSRTLVREALMQLQARGFVEVRSRKGWYVVEPSIEQARDAFAARRAVEAGMLRESALVRDAGKPLQSVIRRLREHLKEEQAAIDSADVATRTFLLADFHVCLAECLGHRVLCDMLRDLTARTTLVASLFQSSHDAQES